MIMQRGYESFNGLKPKDWSRVLEYINEGFERIEGEKQDCLETFSAMNIPTALKTSIMDEIESHYRSATKSLNAFAHATEAFLGITHPI